MKVSTLKDRIRIQCLGCGKTHSLRGFKVVCHTWKDRDGWIGHFDITKPFGPAMVYSLCPKHTEEVNL